MNVKRFIEQALLSCQNVCVYFFAVTCIWLPVELNPFQREREREEFLVPLGQYNNSASSAHKMRGANKYNFDNILVADTRVLRRMNDTDPRPQILVLNNKLNKCHTHQPNCVACCLQIEAPEFKRRSSVSSPDEAECFGKSSTGSSSTTNDRWLLS